MPKAKERVFVICQYAFVSTTGAFPRPPLWPRAIPIHPSHSEGIVPRGKVPIRPSLPDAGELEDHTRSVAGPVAEGCVDPEVVHLVDDDHEVVTRHLRQHFIASSFPLGPWGRHSRGKARVATAI